MLKQQQLLKINGEGERKTPVNHKSLQAFCYFVVGTRIELVCQD